MKHARCYRKNYPRPQFVREQWMDLNGTWDFQFDDVNAGEEERWFEEFPESLKIEVPFSYESQASGIHVASFHPCVWYRKYVDLSPSWVGKRILLHFQAVDYAAKVWVNGRMVGSHEGGYSAFSLDITSYLQEGLRQMIVVQAKDSYDCAQPRGKQKWDDKHFGCWYTQTTGIWQSVWLEPVDANHLGKVKMTPDIDTNSLKLEYVTEGPLTGSHLTLQTIVQYEGQVIRQTSFDVLKRQTTVTLDLAEDITTPFEKVKLWSPDAPNLYDIEFVLYRDHEEIDRVSSYFGMRKISIHGGQVLLNHVPIYQRLILDQGYWPDTLLTPPSEEALVEDIDRVMAMGFNGVRKHQKTEDPRFLYWCDCKGLLVWAEMASAYRFSDDAVRKFTPQWIEVVEQFYNHPSIVTWVPFNESWGVPNILTDRAQQQFTESIYHLTKTIDPNRPVIVNDGWEHTVSDIITLHDYEESAERFTARYLDKEAVLGNSISFNNYKYAMARGYSYRGQPIMISEFGGIAFQNEKGWGYGNQVASDEHFLDRFRRMVTAIKQTEYVCGYCYTQVTDVQQEVNGLLTEQREPKFELETIREINLAQ